MPRYNVKKPNFQPLVMGVLMERRGVKQTHIAEATGIPQSHLSEIIRGVRNRSISEDNQRVIADMLGLRDVSILLSPYDPKHDIMGVFAK